MLLQNPSPKTAAEATQGMQSAHRQHTSELTSSSRDFGKRPQKPGRHAGRAGCSEGTGRWWRRSVFASAFTGGGGTSDRVPLPNADLRRGCLKN